MTPERIAELRRKAAEARLDPAGFTPFVVDELLDALESAQEEIADLKRGGVVVPCGSGPESGIPGGKRSRSVQALRRPPRPAHPGTHHQRNEDEVNIKAGDRVRFKSSSGPTMDFLVGEEAAVKQIFPDGTLHLKFDDGFSIYMSHPDHIEVVQEEKTT